MTIWTPALKTRRGPAYRAIADALGEDIASGRLRPGTRLPTHRELADRLGVTVGTATRGYAEAAQRGLVMGEVGRGTFVRHDRHPEAVEEAAPASAGGTVDLSHNHPAPPGSRATRALQATLGRLRDAPGLDALLAYPPEGGLPAHREAGALWIRRVGLEADPADVVLANGSQHALTAVLATILSPGDVLLAEALAYPGMKSAAALLHLRLQPVGMDDDGIRPDLLEAACRTTAARALYLVPTVHNPTTSVMPEERRRAVAEVARRHGLRIIEDDIHARLPAERPRPVAAFAPDATYYLMSTSKMVAPGLRVGYVLAPRGAASALASTLRVTTWGAVPLMGEIAARWIRDGTTEEILEQRRTEATARQALAREVLAGADLRAHPQGYHAWLQLPDPWRSDSFVAHARRRGVVVTSAESFVVGRAPVPHAVRLCLGSPATREALKVGLQRVADALREPAEPSLSVM